MNMKALISKTVVIVFLVCLSGGAHAQSPASKLDQQKLMGQFLGTWHHIGGKDTIEVWEMQTYGKSFEIKIYNLIKDKKVHIRKDLISLNTTDGKFYGAEYSFDGTISTWLGAFTSEKKTNVDFVKNFDPAIIYVKYEFVLDSPDSFTVTGFSKDGVKTGEYKFTKVKK
jgi:hypothetical protein